MPQINGLNVAKEILAVNPHQRVLFVSAYINSIVEESFATQQLLKQETIEVLQKPVSSAVLIDTIEDRAIYSKLEKFGVGMDSAKAANLDIWRRKVRKSLSVDRETDPPFHFTMYTNVNVNVNY